MVEQGPFEPLPQLEHAIKRKGARLGASQNSCNDEMCFSSHLAAQNALPDVAHTVSSTTGLNNDINPDAYPFFEERDGKGRTNTFTRAVFRVGEGHGCLLIMGNWLLLVMVGRCDLNAKLPRTFLLPR